MLSSPHLNPAAATDPNSQILGLKFMSSGQDAEYEQVLKGIADTKQEDKVKQKAQ